MKKKVTYAVGLLLCLTFLVVPGLTVSLTGCETQKQDKCLSNLDCKDDEACVDTAAGKDCKTKGGLDDSCKENEPPCKLKDEDGKKLICDPNDKVCKNRCETNLDCNVQTQECNIDTGICQKKGGSTDGGTKETAPSDEGGQKISEDCGAGQKCSSGLDCVSLGDQTDGKCWATCKEDKECKEGRLCAAGHCVPKGEECLGTPTGKLTKPCWVGLECLFTGAGGGKCYRTCTKDTECTSGEKCIEKGNKKYCLPSGDIAGAGQECGDIGGKTVGCQNGFQCIPERVNAKKKICTKECKSDAECSWPRFCEKICTVGNAGTVKKGEVCDIKGTTPDKLCDAGLACLPLQKGGALCYRSCKDGRADPCPKGTDCIALGQEKYCLQKCKDAKDCSAPTPTCGQLSGTTGQYCTHGTK